MNDLCVNKTNRECYCANKTNDECFQEYLRQTDPGDEWRDKHYATVFPADGLKLEAKFGVGAFWAKQFVGFNTSVEGGGGVDFSLREDEKLHLVLRGNVGGDFLLIDPNNEPNQAPGTEDGQTSPGVHGKVLAGLGVRSGNVIFLMGPRVGVSSFKYDHDGVPGKEFKTGPTYEGYLQMAIEAGWMGIGGGFILGGYDSVFNAPYAMFGFTGGTYSL